MKQSVTRYFNLASELSNYSFYYKNEIQHKIENNNLEGISILGVSCILFSIFALEARFNILISKKYSNKSITTKSKFHDKFKYFIKDSEFNITELFHDNYTNIRNGESLRNKLVHFEPYKVSKVVTVQNRLPLELSRNDKEKWENLMNHDFSLKVYNSCFILWQHLKKYYNIKPIDEINYAIFIEK